MARSAGRRSSTAIDLQQTNDRPGRPSQMPKWGNQDYKDAVFQQLSQGSSGTDEDHFQHFENFSAGAPRRDVESGVGGAFQPERVPPDQVEPQFRAAAEKIEPQERS